MYYRGMECSVIENEPKRYILQAGNHVQLKHDVGNTITFRNLIILIENAQRNSENMVTREHLGVRFSDLSVDYRENISGTGPKHEAYAIIQVYGTISHLDGKELKEPLKISVYGKKQRDTDNFTINYSVAGVDGQTDVTESRVTSRYVLSAMSLVREKIAEKTLQLMQAFREVIEFEKQQITDGKLQSPANEQQSRLAETHLQENFLKGLAINAKRR